MPQQNTQALSPTQGGQPQVTSQPTNPYSHPSKISANLGFITRMHKELVDHKFPQPQTPQNAPQAPQAKAEPEVEEKPVEEKKEPKNEDLTKLELSITDKLDSVRKELKDDQKGQIDSLKKEIDVILNKKE